MARASFRWEPFAFAFVFVFVFIAPVPAGGDDQLLFLSRLGFLLEGVCRRFFFVRMHDAELTVLLSCLLTYLLTYLSIVSLL